MAERRDGSLPATMRALVKVQAGPGLELTEVPQDEAARAIEAAFVAARVRQVELDDTTVAWVDAR